MKHKLRTAVLVVHGIGSQRPLETVRGVINAVWSKDDHSTSDKRLWSHPEPSGVDIDLTVTTTSAIPGAADGRAADFHELYWAHLMSETKAVAVLLWLFELARRGPWLKPALAPLYWCTLIFLSLLILSVSLLSLQFAIWFVRQVPEVDTDPDFLVGDTHAIIFVFLLAIGIAAGLAALTSIWKGAFKLTGWSVAIAAAAALLFYLAHRYEGAPLFATETDQGTTEALTNLLLPIVLAAAMSAVLMGRWGLTGLLIVLVLSAIALKFVLVIFGDQTLAEAYSKGWIPWSITSFWSSLAAWFFIALYLAMYAAFLQPYLGDAARYFRNAPANVAVRREIRKQAVDTLEKLSTSGRYDRIVVVAHSLGTVVAYDMLRACYSRVRNDLPAASELGTEFAKLDAGTLPKADARQHARAVIKTMVDSVKAARQRLETGTARAGDATMKAWLVTDFVTLGSPLTHAYYLMCLGETEAELHEDFRRRTREREFPTCPPLSLDGDRLMTFTYPKETERHFHHGGQFALTRWTNLYFPVSQVLWGDAIGGPVAAIFGDPDKTKADAQLGRYVADLPVWTSRRRHHSFFAHTLYWDTKQPDGRNAPHIEKLCAAIDLDDSGAVNGLG
jgi:hypothetical protein